MSCPCIHGKSRLKWAVGLLGRRGTMLDKLSPVNAAIEYLATGLIRLSAAGDDTGEVSGAAGI